MRSRIVLNEVTNRDEKKRLRTEGPDRQRICFGSVLGVDVERGPSEEVSHQV